MKKQYLILIVVGTLFILSCGSCGDSSNELSGGYFLRDEGIDVHDILNHTDGLKEIPANVISYNYDNNFIIASQRPNKNPDPLYNRSPIYKDGKNTIYFWLIINKSKLVVGPLTTTEFQQARVQYNVPENLQLKPID